MAVDNIVNGLFGLLQFPLSYLAIHALGGNFLIINLCQVAILSPLLYFCVLLYRWEREVRNLMSTADGSIDPSVC